MLFNKTNVVSEAVKSAPGRLLHSSVSSTCGGFLTHWTSRLTALCYMSLCPQQLSYSFTSEAANLFLWKGNISRSLINLVQKDISPKGGEKNPNQQTSHVNSWHGAIQFQRKRVLLWALRDQLPINTTNKNVNRVVVLFSPSSRALLHSSPALTRRFGGCS